MIKIPVSIDKSRDDTKTTYKATIGFNMELRADNKNVETAEKDIIADIINNVTNYIKNNSNKFDPYFQKGEGWNG